MEKVMHNEVINECCSYTDKTKKFIFGFFFLILWRCTAILHKHCINDVETENVLLLKAEVMWKMQVAW